MNLIKNNENQQMIQKKKIFSIIFVSIFFLLLLFGNYIEKKSTFHFGEVRTVAEADFIFSSPQPLYLPGTHGAVDVNTASQAVLEVLPGVGPAIGERIIEYREEHGDFTSVEELTNVKGIGEKTLENMREFIIVDSAA
ncbi:MAG: helix-hairpin-helix domain-containing protein [Bacillota bacterium]